MRLFDHSFTVVRALLLPLLLSILAYRVQARVLGAAVIPHGDFCYDPSLVNFQNGSQQLHDAARQVCRPAQA